MQSSILSLRSISRSAISFAAISIAGMSLAGAATGNGAWKVPRLSDGRPDLQGNWNNATLTPFERPNEYGNKLVMGADEAAKIENTEAAGNAKANAPTDPKAKIQDLPTDCGRGFTGVNCGYNSFWVDPGTQVMSMNGEKRTSLLTTPNGKVPVANAAGRERMAARRSRGGFNDGPEARSLGERCIMSFGSSAGPPMIPLLYNNNYQIVQTPESVVILVEMVHDARVIRIGGQHKPSTIRQWMGDSVGRWEGDTLVVETVNLRNEQGFRGASDEVKYVEKFTRIGPNQIKYEFQINDPKTWDQPWGGEVAMNKSRDNLYEYACHEGNYALPGILAGARQEETAKAAAEAGKK